MNWGHKIIAVYVVFVAGMLFLAFKSSKQNTDLVAEDYYAKELVYQQKIDEVKRTSALSEKVTVTVADKAVNIRFPKDFTSKKITGEISLYCPSDEKQDKTQTFSVNENILNMPLPGNAHGLHYVKLSWNVEGINYYYEEKIII